MDIIADYTRTAAALLDHVEGGTTDQAPATMTVPVSRYTDPATWQQEMDLIFNRLPLMLAMSAELPNPGDYKAMEVMGKPVLITRGKDGKARAMLNVCTHRGAHVVNDGKGNCNRFTCIYHGWTYANDGNLIGVADRPKFGDVDKAHHGLTQLPCDEAAGMIFVILTPGLPIDLRGFLGGMLDDLEHCGFKDWHYLDSRELVGGNWKIAYDGYLEGYHFATAHPQTIATRTFSDIMTFEAFGPHLRIGFPQVDIAKLRDIPQAQWGTRENNGYDFVRTLFPNVSIFVAPELCQIAQLLPGPTPDRNRTILNFISRKAPADDAERDEKMNMIQFLRDVVNDEDYLLGLSVQRGLDSGAIKHVTFGRNERGNQYFHKWVDYYLQNDPSLPTPEL
ncbi:aromatic ring-hydroxylating oxygenase subunit alpha [Parapedomonas caeni]